MAISKLPTNASLKQVMDKFEEISFLDLSNIDIVVKTELPANVKEGQVVVISENQPSNVILDFYEPKIISENDIFIRLFKTNYGAKQFTVKNKIKKVNMYMFGAEQYINGDYKHVNSYIGESSEWIPMNSYYIVDASNQLDASSNYTMGNKTNSAGTGPYIEPEFSEYMFKFLKPSKSNNILQTGWITTKNPINLRKYSLFHVDLKGSYGENASNNQFTIQLLSNDKVISDTVIQCGDVFAKSEKEYSLTIDVSSINEDVQVKFMLKTQVMGKVQVDVVSAYFS